MLVGATAGIPVHRSNYSKPDAWRQDGNHGRIKRWYGEDHVVVNWYGLSDADAGEHVGSGRDDEGGTYGLIAISKDEYLRRCCPFGNVDQRAALLETACEQNWLRDNRVKATLVACHIRGPPDGKDQAWRGSTHSKASVPT